MNNTCTGQGGQPLTGYDQLRQEKLQAEIALAEAELKVMREKVQRHRESSILSVAEIDVMEAKANLLKAEIDLKRLGSPRG